jgi:stage IV sporulation protein FB
LEKLLNFLFFINVYWGLVNLLPVFPLDGGHISREVFLYFDPRRGIPRSLMLSIVAAVAVALYLMFHFHSINGLLFAYFAYESYLMLRAYSGFTRW